MSDQPVPQPLVFPELITMDECGNNFETFLGVVYEEFTFDFVDSKPHYRGTRLGLKRMPITDGREATFYHITHKGADEANRVPDIRRMERIKYPKFVINNCDHPEFLVWENERRKDEIRVLIYHPEERYLVVLNKRPTYILLWTAYLVEQNHSHRKLLAEYEAYKKANAAQ